MREFSGEDGYNLLNNNLYIMSFKKQRMIERTNVRTLRELSSEYNVVLMDSSILYHKLMGNAKEPSEQEKSIAERLKFFDVLENYVDEGVPFSITSQVYQEYIQGHFPYKKILRRKEVQLDRQRLELARKIMNMEKRGRRIVDILSDCGRIIELTDREKELYDSLSQTNFGRSCYGLGKVDADFLISGVVMSKTRGTTCLASNDFKMFYKWRDFVIGQKIDTPQFGFAVRVDINSFKLLDSNHR